MFAGFRKILPLQPQSREKATKQKLNGALVQLVRIHACHAWGHGFESRTHRIIFNYNDTKEGMNSAIFVAEFIFFFMLLLRLYLFFVSENEFVCYFF